MHLVFFLKTRCDIFPPVPVPDFAGGSTNKHPFVLMLQMQRQYNENLESFLRSIPRQRLHSLVIDMFCVDATDVATKLGIPVYTFIPTGASLLAVLTQLPALFASRQTGLKELGDTPLEFLGVPPMPASHLIAELLAHPEDETCKVSMSIFERGMGTMGVLVNTYESHSGIPCVPGKPERSVVFLCFGSLGTFSEEQLKEMAVGLDRSGQRFLWVVRMPANIDDPTRILENQYEPDLDALLPEGFLERTKGRGLVVKSWAPQVEVLNHPATGAFVTHYGWNSMMEGVIAGVPMLCWPLYAEQKMNKVFMTEDMGIGMEIEGYMTGFNKADEVEAKLRLVIESKEGRKLKARVAARKKEAEVALEAGGSSHVAFLQFLLDVENLGDHQLADAGTSGLGKSYPLVPGDLGSSGLSACEGVRLARDDSSPRPHITWELPWVGGFPFLSKVARFSIPLRLSASQHRIATTEQSRGCSACVIQQRADPESGSCFCSPPSLFPTARPRQPDSPTTASLLLLAAPPR
ncbi:hypothetical protein HU200_012038 [Digitaria exilis]|uniref:Glycosyltransferase n=1 Tax=Digitaria exilis TaxID=1010633 RepID=A0A835FF78_9POAL|nr:hypothetical protein HU200_012038 [Digitaria exilis]